MLQPQRGAIAQDDVAVRLPSARSPTSSPRPPTTRRPTPPPRWSSRAARACSRSPDASGGTDRSRPEWRRRAATVRLDGTEPWSPATRRVSSPWTPCTSAGCPVATVVQTRAGSRVLSPASRACDEPNAAASLGTRPARASSSKTTGSNPSIAKSRTRRPAETTVSGGPDRRRVSSGAVRTSSAAAPAKASTPATADIRHDDACGSALGRVGRHVPRREARPSAMQRPSPGLRARAAG